ncbi:hypothetical protein [Fructobacillus evanidus]|uniref:Membrane protein TolA involved in colicin uptake (TolA) n=1 Tax=Fructobacillus evanidus TaxID=3064281 RepID=A0ABM9MTX8_9LACO|nr:Membrane protein TolA involved in colicin uptake (TolA) [Fructobacillus sp. LMG 32999]CAK1238998.1 Membrane protein TolA involved in colicin uptake (TolA) [Fructobacillus sp. LMG 32999]CAK1239808.1 Membrane protein TolA involved in colicin uptake (TolA) [Fructobacillus sp. LMG 32999]CAK1244899.1 Membrane protein TolA involved in colicin uptake (TolA) [Fructobacillus sp. LMG 32999]CAK1244953.1 Membrane protein TolA involved in colicin uptake (TolA) [Fructobacillus sp. LMG 32999]
MTSRTEWEEYFELINDRRPNENEIVEAFQKGEFEDEDLKRMAEQVAREQAQQVQQQAPVNNQGQNAGHAQEQASVNNQNQNAGYAQEQAPVNNQNQNAGYAQEQAPVNNQNQNAGYAQQQAPVNNESDDFNQVVNNEEKSNPTLNDFKNQANNFFGWYWERAVHPTNHLNDEKPNTAFLWLSLAITSFLSAGVFWNVLRRAVDTFSDYAKNQFNATIANKVSSIGGQFLPTAFFDFLVAFVIIFLAALGGLAIVTRTKVDFKHLLNQYLAWFPTASLFAAASFIYSFVASVPSIQNISNPNTFLSNLATTVGVLLGLLFLAIVVNQYSAYYFVQKHQEGNEKIDLIWWQLLQFVVTVVILVIAYDVVVSPMFQSLFSTISSAISSAY